MVHRNAIPFDLDRTWLAGSIRVGTAAVTTRSFGTEEMKQIASLILKFISNISDSEIKSQLREQVTWNCQRFPILGIDG